MSIETSTTGQYMAALAVCVLASLVAADLSTEWHWLRLVCFGTAVCWSFLRLATGPAFCALVAATLMTDYLVIAPIYSISFDVWTMVTLTCYFAIAMIVVRLNERQRGGNPHQASAQFSVPGDKGANVAAEK